jgi:hypothetical protein
MQKPHIARDLFIRVVGYATSLFAAWIVYFWFVVAKVPGPGSIRDRFLAASILALIGGFSAALALMAFPWVFVVWIYSKIRLSGPAFFACAGVLLMILIGCVASSLSWKPLFIEDQTFWEGALIALERQGIGLALAGATLGLGYWSLAERSIARNLRPVVIGSDPK